MDADGRCSNCGRTITTGGCNCHHYLSDRRKDEELKELKDIVAIVYNKKQSSKGETIFISRELHERMRLALGEKG